MPKRQRPLIRDGVTERDASLILIASEDTYAPEKYFRSFKPRRVQFRFLPTAEGRSSPRAIVNRLNEYKAEFQIGEDDELWYCGDIDHWAASNHIPNLHRVLSHCHNQRFRVALSNPCFEVWLLLHFEEAPEAELDCDTICKLLRAAAGGYSKPNGCAAKMTKEHVLQAVARAGRGDTGDVLPLNPASQVHRIVTSMANRQSIVLR